MIAHCVDQLRAFAREHLRGGCKMLSMGDACPCNLCAVDTLAARVSQLEAAELTDAYNLLVESHNRAVEYREGMEGLPPNTIMRWARRAAPERPERASSLTVPGSSQDVAVEALTQPRPPSGSVAP